MNQTTLSKPFSISYASVEKAYLAVKGNKGGCGVDQVSLDAYGVHLKQNLYKLWNRMSSGTYFPPPVRLVEIPKKAGGVRPLGIPTVEDRIAQTVVKQALEAILDPIFHSDSYGYRPQKSALEAVGKARERCWKYDWVLDVDIQGFFDNIDHTLLMKAVRKHTPCRWHLLYLERWLKAPVQKADGSLHARPKGTPQGSVVSPLLANLFLHYAMDEWLRRNFAHCPFERYADDAVIHCRSEQEAQQVRVALEQRLSECSLTLHPQKTKLVYCKDSSRKRKYSTVQFDFLGYRFSPRKVRNRQGGFFTGYNPAVSKQSVQSMRQKAKEWTSLYLSQSCLLDVVEQINPVVRGWIRYYGAYYGSKLKTQLQFVNDRLAIWARKKYKRLKGSRWLAMQWLKATASKTPDLFAHWQIGTLPQGGL